MAMYEMAITLLVLLLRYAAALSVSLPLSYPFFT